jgi:hypothetical protein
MKTTPILGPVALTAGAVSTEGNVTEVDLSRQGLSREFIISAKITENTTAPGSARTVTLHWYWSDERIAGPTITILAARLLARKDNTTPTALHGVSTAMTRSTAASETKYFTVSTTVLRPIAKYLYLTVTKTTEDSGSIPTLTVFLTRVPSTAIEL